MFLFRTLSVPGSVAKKAPVISLVLFPLLAQSCTAISYLAQRNDQSLTVPQVSNDLTPAGANIKKVSVESDIRVSSPQHTKLFPSEPRRESLTWTMGALFKWKLMTEVRSLKVASSIFRGQRPEP
jgi:hypothetical protein